MKRLKKVFFLAMSLITILTVSSCNKTDENTFKVGILQYASHNALDNATNGFKEQLTARVEAAGKKVLFTFKNPAGDTQINKTMANDLVRKSDLVLGNATPSAYALKVASLNEGKKDLPIVFVSVTDPTSVENNLVESWDKPGANITGVSDINPVTKQIAMISEYNSDIKKIGFLYNIAETNSKYQVDSAIAYAKANGYLAENLIVKTVSQISEIDAQVNSLINDGVGAIYLPTDNMMADNMGKITNITNEKKVPVFCGESGMVSNGGTFSLSISYYALGKKAGDMAADILLNGSNPKDMAVKKITDEKDLEFAYNKENINAMKLPLTTDFKTKYNIVLD